MQFYYTTGNVYKAGRVSEFSEIPITTQEFPCDSTVGLGVSSQQWKWALAFDLEGVYRYLSVPHQMRNADMGLYKASDQGQELIWVEFNGSVSDKIPTPSVVNFDREMDLAKVVSANLGVELVWAPYEFNNVSRFVSFSMC